MKTFLVMYMLAFVSIIVIYVQEHRTSAGEVFDPYAMAGQMMSMHGEGARTRVEVKPEKPEVKPEEAGRPEAGAVRRADLPEVIDFDHYQHTFEGLDKKIKDLSAGAGKNPDLYVSIADCYYIKANMYRERIRTLDSIESDDKGGNIRKELERKYTDSLEQALKAVNKAPRNVYRNTDTRLIKALIYLCLPGREHKAIPELESLADDPQALPELRGEARDMLERHDLRD